MGTKHRGPHDTYNAADDSRYRADGEEYNDSRKLLLCHNPYSLTGNGDGCSECIQGDIEDSYYLKRAEENKHYGKLVVIILYTLRGEERKEEEQKVINDGSTGYCVVIIVTNVKVVKIHVVKYVEQDRNVRKDSRGAISCEAHSVSGQKSVVSFHFSYLLAEILRARRSAFITVSFIRRLKTLITVTRRRKPNTYALKSNQKVDSE